MSPVYKRLEKDDIQICRAFMSIVKQGKFEVKGDALQQCGALLKWANDLEKRIEETLKPIPVVQNDPKPIEEKKKK